MLLVLAVAVLVVAAAVVVLFAMVGELASRVADPAANRPTPIAEPYRDIELGRVAVDWPDGLPAGARCVLLVLSTMCNSCAEVAEQVAAQAWPELGVVVTTGGRHSAADFIAEHGLSEVPHHVDEGGEWVSAQFGVRHSPLALVVRDRRLIAAYGLNNVAALRRRIEADEPAEVAG